MPIGSIVGGLIGQSGSQTGGDMAWGAAQWANDQNLREADKSRRQLSPWTSSGIGALGKITKLLGMGELTQEGNNYGQYWLKGDNAAAQQQEEMNAFRTTPGYEFRLNEGVKARDRAAGAKGLSLSGAQQKALTQWGQDIGSEEYNNYFNQLSSLSGGGQVATSNANSTAAGLTAAGSNALYQGGVQRGSAYARGANSLASGIGKATENAFALGYTFL